jgi:hypothetical protein
LKQADILALKHPLKIDSVLSATIEDECHFLISCSLYDKILEQLFTQLSSFACHDIKKKPDLFNIIINTYEGDHEFTTHVCAFVNSCFEKRKLSENTVTITKQPPPNILIVKLPKKG